MTHSSRKSIAIWLLFTAFCVFGMIVLGGLTRLTESGLSIVHWKPFTGALPPLSDMAWQAEFDAYRTSPQYKQINFGMTIEQFKGIFWLEYLHRLAGRLIGLVFLLPLIYFTIRHQLNIRLGWRLTGIFLLGGLQGIIGWYMVKSGLIDVPSVSPYRLALHLGTAFILLGLLIWTALDLLPKRKTETPPLLKKFCAILACILFLQILLGALVAGLDAGLTYNTFPLMDGHFIPNGLYVMKPFWKNHFENVATVQFQHRIGAYLVAAFGMAFVFFTYKYAIVARLKYLLMLFSALLIGQIVLGIATLLYGVPILLASLHQAIAVLLFAVILWIWHGIKDIGTYEF